MDSAQVILWRAGADCRNFSYVNQEAEDLLGYPTQVWTREPAFWVDHLSPGRSARRWSRVAAQPRRIGRRNASSIGWSLPMADWSWLRTSVRLVASNGQSKEIAGGDDGHHRPQIGPGGCRGGESHQERVAGGNQQTLHDRLKHRKTSAWAPNSRDHTAIAANDAAPR